MDRLLRQSEVLTAVGISRQHLYKIRQQPGGFPEPVDVGGAMLRWRESEIQKWIASR